VLPSTFFFEEGPDWRGSYGHSFLCRTEAILPPPGECLGDLAILEGVRKTLGLSLSPEALRHSMDSLLLERTDMEKIHPSVYAWREQNFWEESSSFAKLPLRLPSPHPFEEPVKRLNSSEELRLITCHVGEYINGQNWDLPEQERIPISLSTEDAKRFGLSSGSRVRLWNSKNPCGISGEVLIDPRMGSGYCAVPQGGSRINSLTDPLVSPGYGVPFSESFVRVRIEKEC
jgi:anaerobic selenocysteine-containing dehydrogenase